jgi:RNA polymerase subunit RPABC4/transcription elongation factor Spt4
VFDDDARFCPSCGKFIKGRANFILEDPAPIWKLEKLTMQTCSCPSCGEVFDDDARFCPNCGQIIKGRANFISEDPAPIWKRFFQKVNLLRLRFGTNKKK